MLFLSYSFRSILARSTDRKQDHHDALALVTVNDRIATSSLSSELPPSGQPQDEDSKQSADDDLRRAKDLVELHYELKARHVDGQVDRELAQAREGVDRVLRELGR